MDKSELLAEFKAQLALFDKYRTFIDKARNYAERFNPAVVEKVISDNSAKIDEVGLVLNPLVDSFVGVVEQLRADREDVLKGVEEARLQVEELELRQMIGEMDDEAFEEATSGLRQTIDEADDKVAALDLEIEDFSSTLEKWLDNRPAVDDPHEDLLGELEEDEGVELEADDEEDLIGFEDAEDPGESGVHAQAVTVEDDVSAVFDDGGHTVEAPIIEADDGGGIDFSPGEIDDIGEDLFSEPAAEQADEEGEGQAVLIMGESTAEEHVYALTGDVLSLGRGRDNNVQVKNDSKVSRYHCKMFKRGGHYFIADNKSANGTLVDGELITEKRLVGGEEVIVGETFFRFRIQR